MLVEYSASEIIGPLPSGSYTAFAWESVVSLRLDQGEFVVFPLDACCPGTEAPVTDLRLQKINDGNGVGFTWTDVLGATEYNLYGDVEPDGAFDHQLGSSTTGTTGIDLPVQAAAFFLLTPGSACGGGG